MNMTKKINVNFSSLVGLKAELLRKQAEVNEVKLKNASISGLLQMNKKRKNKNVVKDMEKNTKELLDLDDVVAHKKSKLMLEAKAKLYKKLKESRNNDNNFLVDFKNKSDESDDEFVDEAINEKHPIESEENWVEYQDCFGCTRKCLREDLPHMQKKNELIKQEIMKGNIGRDREEENEAQVSVPEKEPEIEIMRRKWEEQTRKLADKVDIHYQDILFDEARMHGVSYYAFSQDEDERAKQQENLANLRKETERKQMEMKEIKDLKERMESNRLKMARIRQRIRAGLPAEPTEEELAQKSKIDFTDNSYAEKSDEIADNYTEKSDEKTAGSIEKIDACKEENNEDEDKITIFGELLCKKNWHVMSQEEWVHKCRAQRIGEFGPIYDNFMSAGFYNESASADRELVHEDNRSNPENCNSKKSMKEFTTELKNCENYNNSANNGITSNAVYIDSHNQNDNSLAECDTVTNKNNTGRELPRNLIESVTLNSATNVSNSQPSQVQPSASCLLSHSSNYLQDVDNNLGIYTCEEHKEKNDTTSVSSDLHVIKPEALLQNINEDSIMAGLKYLREKFEETHSK
ncbi:hypothetical protein DMN91_009559 [Ooceraea biroi]|uniref:CCDC174 alpha/beta GRSR domain-containing protein n=1 Tax=Ooceraea biroi TaxID=2015173 RepID=A0A3L8DAG4_OOCBI|nr:coiled-coil domain-containing protein 174 [Ooceraea biroi]XP_011352422.2 coiled-coil domain-containing protein 174 [Ooceraea biroi]XP_026829223.1 coiled-coil domain-containing protein 174 [Ooceraea biroi]XP_026829224.1 coiled-coil domain-containing protein 174 [Ooceraea biroi]XP_026829225.1 coiled-coil domain-containing protein 174 [Ooceraea biroi]XP_026829226.1 coiled-coil domain-containing protein 174 [Ooceraea biroi]XP_026829227.1 coiled-coil domain-containing protein 174 [Ooceraea biro